MGIVYSSASSKADDGGTSNMKRAGWTVRRVVPFIKTMSRRRHNSEGISSPLLRQSSPEFISQWFPLLDHVLGSPARSNRFSRHTTIANRRVVAMAIAMVPAVTTSRCTPSNLPRERGMRELGVGKVKRHTPVEGNVVDAPVPDGCICHPVRRKGHDCADNCAGKNIVPVHVRNRAKELKGRASLDRRLTSCGTRQWSGHRQ